MNTQQLIDSGFALYNAGGNCLALEKKLANGNQVLVSDGDGGLELQDGWCVSIYDAVTGDEVQLHYDCADGKAGAPTIEAALIACGAIATVFGK